MYQLTIDQMHNKLVLTLRPNMNTADFNRIDEHLRRVIPTMLPGFTLINNISQFSTNQRFPTQLFQDLLEFIKAHKVGRVIRVVGGSKSAMLFFHEHSQAVQNYTVQHVPTISDAMKRLPMTY